MSNIAFLLFAVGVSVVGSVVLWLRTRKPTTVGSSIDSFHREMRALAPEPEEGRHLDQPSGVRRLDPGEER